MRKIEMKESFETFFPYISGFFTEKLEAWVICMMLQFKCDSLNTARVTMFRR